METSTDIYTHSVYGTEYTALTSTGTKPLEQHPEHPDYYDLFLLIQDLLRSDEGFILEFPIDHWDVGAVSIGLGSGGFSSVSRHIAKRYWGNRSVMAYKRIRPSFDSEGRTDEWAALAQVVNEIKVLSAASIRSHENINRLRGVVFEAHSNRSDGRLFPALIIDPSPLGSLRDFIRDPVRMVDGPYWQCCMDVGRGLQALHTNRFIHGDVKCENVLVFPAANYEGRDFVARLTDFGASMALDMIEPNTYTKLRGATPPYDAPESDSTMLRDHLPFTDIYSYGILIWRVAIDGAEPFNQSRYRQSTLSDEGGRYNLALIRNDKRNENLLNAVLHEILDPALGLWPDTAECFSEILSIALGSDPTKRDLKRIMEIFEVHQRRLHSRTFGLSQSSGRLLRDYTKPAIRSMLGFSRSRYGLAEWNSIPPKAHHFYHVIHRYGTFDSSFRGFGLSRLPPVSEGLRDLLVAIERVYSACRRPVPPMETLRPVASLEPVAILEDISNQIFEIIGKTSKDTLQVASTCLGRPQFISVMGGISDALKKLADICQSMSSLFGSAAGYNPHSFSSNPEKEEYEENWHTQGLYDRPGGLAAIDTDVMTNERAFTKPQLPAYKLSSYLDFHLLSTCKLPFALQEQLFADISSRVRRLANCPERGTVTMEQAICYGLGFGVEQDHTRYLSIANECCVMGYRPAQKSMQQLYNALGLPLPKEIQSSPLVSEGEGFDASNAISSISLLGHLSSPIHEAAIDGSITVVERMLNLDISQLNKRNSAGDTPLMAACRVRNLSIARFLMDKGADCDARNNYGETCLHWAWTFDFAIIPNLISRMIHMGADPNAIASENLLSDPHLPFSLVSGTALHYAVARGSKETVQALIRGGASVSQAGGPVSFHKRHCSSMDPIQLACTWHEAEILEILLDSAPFYPINSETSGGINLLYFAIQCQSTHHRMARHGSNMYWRLQETIDLLMSRGCTSAVDNDGYTALHLAVTSNSPEVLEYILTFDAFNKDINAMAGGKSVLHWAISMGRPATFELLIRNGADVLQSPISGHSLDFAIRLARGNDFFFKRILELGEQSITQTDKNQVLRTALRESQWELARFLTDNGADINGLAHPCEYSRWRYTVLGEVLQTEDAGKIIEMLEFIINLSSKRNQELSFIVFPELYESALHVSAGHLFLHDKHETARLYSMLLEVFPGKCHLEARNLKGWTPLHAAISARNVVAVRAFLDAGADVNSMTLIEGSPVGPSAKDKVFTQLFSRESYYELNASSRNEGDRALEQLFKIFREAPVAKIAKRSITLRAEQRGNMSSRDRQVANFVDALSFLPSRLPRVAPKSTMAELMENMKIGASDEFIRDFKLDAREVARNVQWSGIEGVRFLRQEGGLILRVLGLLEEYLDDQAQ